MATKIQVPQELNEFSLYEAKQTPQGVRLLYGTTNGYYLAITNEEYRFITPTDVEDNENPGTTENAKELVHLLQQNGLPLEFTGFAPVPGTDKEAYMWLELE